MNAVLAARERENQKQGEDQRFSYEDLFHSVTFTSSVSSLRARRRARFTKILAIRTTGRTIRTRIGKRAMTARIRKRMIARATSTPSANADLTSCQKPTAFTICVGVCSVTLIVGRLA